MAIKESLLPELEQEAASTRKLLERVPEDKLGWKPAEKSMTLSQLANHLANLPTWAVHALTGDELDIAPPGEEPYVADELGSVSEIVDSFDANLAKMREAIETTSDERFVQPWTLKNAGKQVFTMPRVAVLRSMILNHLIHHRGQLTVYLRLNDVPLPGIYGPSADDSQGMG